MLPLNSSLEGAGFGKSKKIRIIRYIGVISTTKIDRTEKLGITLPISLYDVDSLSRISSLSTAVLSEVISLSNLSGLYPWISISLALAGITDQKGKSLDCWKYYRFKSYPKRYSLSY
jgi:hypothetical protein